MKLVTVVGARPQFVKAAALSRVLRSEHLIQEVLVHTGQHYDHGMSAVFFDELSIPQPAHNLGIGSGSQGAQTGRMLSALEQVMVDEKPDAVLVYGDTNSTLAAALAAVKLHLPLVHVESGLRSFNRRMPEEVNRVLTDHMANLLLAPTTKAVENLRKEGLHGADVVNVGDIMYDAVLFYSEKAKATSEVLHRLGLSGAAFVLATVHRAENTDDDRRLAIILQALAGVAETIPVALPLHPRTQHAIDRLGLPGLPPAVKLLPPVGYLDMIQLESNASLVVTDSGGVQKEAFFARKPCVTVRDETEWVELVELGWNILAPLRTPEELATQILDAIGRRGTDASPYGDGTTANQIAALLKTRI